MKVIVPLAGPDFELPGGGTKAEQLLGGQPLLRRALDGRPWANKLSPDDYIFVMRDSQASRGFSDRALQLWYPGSQTVYLSQASQGAALSAAAGAAMAGTCGPIIIDLADIDFRCEMTVSEELEHNALIGAIALTFPSTNPGYSYIQEDADGNFVRAAEKVVISAHASAGVYIFRDTAIFYAALAYCMRHFEQHTHNGLYYVCPLFNGVAAAGWQVVRREVTNVFDIKFG